MNTLAELLMLIERQGCLRHRGLLGCLYDTVGSWDARALYSQLFIVPPPSFPPERQSQVFEMDLLNLKVTVCNKEVNGRL